ncbi:MAG: hypothetical protein HY594_05510, partial [Candidatus Omnitrophica bacterium]|nr:hypothetical protein [Candidatus Omnitrophota bacterium]
YKNRIRTILKNAQGVTLLWMLPFHLACCLALAAMGALQPRRWANAWAILRAIGWNVRHLPATWQARRRIQALRQVSDRELFRQILRPIPVRDFALYTWWTLWSRERLRDQVHGLKGSMGSNAQRFLT